MTIVIPYKDEVHKGLELKYALRSIEKNLSGWDKIFIIAAQFPPFEYADPVIDKAGLETILEFDVDGRKEYSCYRKLLAACNDERVSENFVYWNDDHWLLKPLHVSEIKNWHNGSLADEIKKPHSARWRMAAENTLRIQAGSNNYDIHYPMIFSKDAFKTIFQNETEELCIKTRWMQVIGCGGPFMEDCNLSSMLTYSEIKQAIDGKLFCSSKGGITKEYFRVLEELFPDKSRFEF